MIKRFIFNRLCDEINQPEINILLGPRQVGKTTLLHALEEYAQRNGLSTKFFDLEQPQTLAEFNQSDKDIINKICSAGEVIFIDEFQYIRNASKILKAIVDAKTKIKIFCSGSSSLEIHKHLKESLAGRRFLFRIYPLEYAEIKQHLKNSSLETYLRYGGLPALTKTDSEERKQQILAELLSSYILKDIKSLIKEENIRAFNHLVYLLAEHQSSMISVHNLANQINLSSNTINRYLDILEETYVNFRIHSFSNNLGNELKKSCKTYIYDLGIRNAILKDFSRAASRGDKGALLEGFVFLKLQAMLTANREIKFWRTKDGDEVDFIFLQDRKPLPIEVKSTLPEAQIPKGLKRFLARYPRIPRAMVINENISQEVKQNSQLIQFITLDQFALKKDIFPS